MAGIRTHFRSKHAYSMALLALCLCFIALMAYADHQLGDLAPRGSADGQLNAGDLVIMQRLVTGDLIPPPTADELIIGDVAPLNAPDGLLNAADILILQRAIFGEITLGTVDIASVTPILDVVTSPTNANPYPVSGTATPGDTVTVYVDGTPSGVAVADLGTGIFSVPVVLTEGNNSIYAIANDGVDSSPQSLTVIVNFQYIDGGSLSGVACFSNVSIRC